MITGIYKILNKINNKFYIGSAINIKQRWRQHNRYLNLNEHQNIHLQRAWNKYWDINFEFIILELCKKDKLIEREQIWLNWLKPEYNLSPTAGSSLGVKHSEESRKRMSEAKKKITEETRRIMSETRKGRIHTLEAKIRMSEIHKGHSVLEETKIKIGNANRGKKRSEETKSKISAGNKNLGTKRGKYKTKTEKFFENLTNPPLINY